MSIMVKTGDIFYFSAVNVQEEFIEVTNEILLAGILKVDLAYKAVELEEVKVNNLNNINAVSLRIIPKTIVTKTPAERRLSTAGDFKPIQLLNILGGSMPLDPVFNAINGKTKRLKKELVLEKKESDVLFLKEKYQQYLKESYKLTDDEALQFIWYAIEEKDIEKHIVEDNDLTFKFYLNEIYLKFNDIQNKAELMK
ncbi:hypothetical protein [Flavobacterium sp. 3HN19-14]|uniref:hypothetical protein n=1 Tax=Flavobacterium sp. 3HN19-14 TaxID=3448133 RepID=UPI003EE12CD3